MRTGTMPRLVACLVAGLAIMPVATAFALPVTGKKLTITISPTGKNKVVLKIKDTLVDSGNLGSAGDPRCVAEGGGGGALRLNDGAGNDLTIPLPCEGWFNTNGGTGDVNNIDYRYRDTTQTTCTRVKVIHGRSIGIVCKGPQVAWTLGAAEGAIDATLRLGSLPIRDCTTFGPSPTRVLRDGSDGRTYRAKDAPRPATCTSSPSGAFLDVED